MVGSAPVLYAEAGVRVTPTWIGVEDVSHAVKNVVRLRRVRRARARSSWRALCAAMALLALLGLVAALRGALPFALAWAAFSVSTAFALLAAWHGFVAADGLAVEIGLADGTRFEAPASSERQLERLHAALAHALDWHGGTVVTAPPGLADGFTPGGGPVPGGGSAARDDPTPPGRSGQDVVRVVDRDGRVV